MEKKVKDIMAPIEGFPTVTMGAAVKDAVAVLGKAIEAEPCMGHAAVLVMDDKTLVGTVGLKEILQAIEPLAFKGGTFRGWTVSGDGSPPLCLRGLFAEKCGALAARPVKEIMSPISRFIKTDDPLIKAVHALTLNALEAVPVWQESRVVGMVGNIDLFNEVLSLQLNRESGVSGRKRVAG